MSETRQLAVYLHLARACQQRHRPQSQDRMLVLAGVTAANLELEPIARHCRHLVLLHNPHHLLRRWETIQEALWDNDFLALLKQLRRKYPLEKGERLLETLGIRLENEALTYATPLEYAASLLGLAPESWTPRADPPEETTE